MANDSWVMAQALAAVCHIEMKLATVKLKAQLFSVGKMLREYGVKPEDVRPFGEWWYTGDWRGRQGDPPTPAQVRSEWGKYKRSKEEDLDTALPVYT